MAVRESPFLNGYHAKFLVGYYTKDKGGPCEQGETAANTGCIPKEKESANNQVAEGEEISEEKVTSSKQPKGKKRSLKEVKGSIDSMKGGDGKVPMDKAADLIEMLDSLSTSDLKQFRAETRAKLNRTATHVTKEQFVEALRGFLTGQATASTGVYKPTKYETSKGKEDERTAGGDGAGGGPASPSRKVERTPKGPAGKKPDRGRAASSKPAGKEPAKRIPAKLEEVNKKLDRLEKFFRKKGQHHVADWMGMLRGHFNNVGIEDIIKSLGEEVTGGYEGDVQYQGAAHEDEMFMSMGGFAEKYLNRNGIVAMFDPVRGGPRAAETMPLVASSVDISSFIKRTKDFAGSDFGPADPEYANKLEEAKLLPGLKKSEDISVIMGKETPQLTESVIAKLDKRFGKGQWVVKAYGDEACAGFGVYFPQRAAQLQRDAQNLIWAADNEIKKYGFELNRDKNNKIIGIKHTSGGTYDFGTSKYEGTIGGDVRNWCDKLTYVNPISVALVSGGDANDRAGSAIDNEYGACLPGGGHQFMAQSAFEAVGATEEYRKAGGTIAPGEARVHIITRNGKAEIVPHATWIKKQPLPVVFETEETRAMAKAVQDVIDGLPEEHRSGQIYSPDVIKVEGGYKVIELNPSKHKQLSGYLQSNPFVQDAYVSHLVGREPAHVQFIRKLVTSRERGIKNLMEIRTKYLGTFGIKMEVRKDKRGHKYCVDDSGRTSCPQDLNEGEGRRKKPKAAKKTPAKKASAKKAPIKKSTKAKPIRSVMAYAQREGEGKTAKVVMADGSPAPKHITAKMVGHDWVDVQIAMDPKADVLVIAKDKNGKPKTVYADKWVMKSAADKFSKVREGLLKMDGMAKEVQSDRKKSATKEQADCTWLMSIQGTRPGSEADNKGTAQHFGHEIFPKDVVVQGDKVMLRVGDTQIPIKDKKTKAELIRRKEKKLPLFDSTYWLKSHGATTLEGRHVVEDNGKVFLRFVGKESVYHNHEIKDPDLAKMLLERKKASGEDGQLFDTDEGNLSRYVRKLDGGKFTPKDLRTIRGTKYAIEVVQTMEPPTNEKEYKAKVKEVGEIVCKLLGNDFAMALKAYIDPSIFSAWQSVLGVK